MLTVAGAGHKAQEASRGARVERRGGRIVGHVAQVARELGFRANRGAWRRHVRVRERRRAAVVTVAGVRCAHSKIYVENLYS